MIVCLFILLNRKSAIGNRESAIVSEFPGLAIVKRETANPD
jgi:hypothetical protein